MRCPCWDRPFLCSKRKLPQPISIGSAACAPSRALGGDVASASPPGPCGWSRCSVSTAVARAFLISSAPPEEEGVAAAFPQMVVRAHLVWINSSATVKPCAVRWNPQSAVDRPSLPRCQGSRAPRPLSPDKEKTEGWRWLEPKLWAA